VTSYTTIMASTDLGIMTRQKTSTWWAFQSIYTTRFCISFQDDNESNRSPHSMYGP